MTNTIDVPCGVPALQPATNSAYSRTQSEKLPQGGIWTPPSPIADQLYRGKVSTFFNGKRGSYCESYEAPRLTAYGAVSRIESRLVGGRWRHQAFRRDGELVTTEEQDLLLFDQTNLPLMFNPEEERDFATLYLAACAHAQIVHLSKDIVIYKSDTGLSVGIVRFKLNTPKE